MVSISTNPRRAASAASAASSTGWSLALVTWAWLAGVWRHRIFCMAIMISTMFMTERTPASFAGVSPPKRRRTSRRGTLMSTSIRASSWQLFPMASTATAVSRA